MGVLERDARILFSGWRFRYRSVLMAALSHADSGWRREGADIVDVGERESTPPGSGVECRRSERSGRGSNRCSANSPARSTPRSRSIPIKRTSRRYAVGLRRRSLVNDVWGLQRDAQPWRKPSRRYRVQPFVIMHNKAATEGRRRDRHPFRHQTFLCSYAGARRQRTPGFARSAHHPRPRRGLRKDGTSERRGGRDGSAELLEFRAGRFMIGVVAQNFPRLDVSGMARSRGSLIGTITAAALAAAMPTALHCFASTMSPNMSQP